MKLRSPASGNVREFTDGEVRAWLRAGWEPVDQPAELEPTGEPETFALPSTDPDVSAALDPTPKEG